MINNFVYQSDYQIPQVILVSILLVATTILISLNKYTIKFKYIIFSFILFIYLICVPLKASNIEDYHRSILNFSIVILYLFVFFTNPLKYINKYFVYLFTVLFFIFGLIILFLGDRTFINPNWWAMSLFYLFAICDKARNHLTIIGVILFSFLIFESRGASLSWIVVYSSLILLKVDHRIVRYGYILSFIIVVSLSIIILEILVIDINKSLTFFSFLGDRGLGGREGALVLGYQLLKDSLFIGKGLLQETSLIVNEVKGISVKIHYGLLDLALKFSVLTPFIISVILFQLILSCSKKNLPFLLGGITSIFYYNGLGISHVGLNLLLISLISKSSPSKNLK